MAGSNEELRARLQLILDADYCPLTDDEQATVKEAIAALAPAQEPAGGGEGCHCDAVNLGAAEATCGDCPRDYATPTPQAAGVSEELAGLFIASLGDIPDDYSKITTEQVIAAIKQNLPDYPNALTAASLREKDNAIVGAAPEGWQAIETAPKDGSDILVICMGAPQPTASEAHWNGSAWVACSADTLNSVGEEWVESIGVFNRATHWMRKPVAPTATPQPGAQGPRQEARRRIMPNE